MRLLASIAFSCVTVSAQVAESRPVGSAPANRDAAPLFEAPSRIFVDVLLVRVCRPPEGLLVRHTLDGSEPGPRSAPAPGELTLRETTTLRLRHFAGDRPVGASVEATFTKVLPRPGLAVANLELGLRYTSKRGSFPRIPELTADREEDWRPCARFELLGPLREEHVAARFLGFLRIDEPAVYEFVLTSKDGSRLSLGGKVVLDNDGVHERRSVRTELALGEGMHLLQLDWFHTTGEPHLDLAFAKAGRAVESIPVTALSRGKRE